MKKLHIIPSIIKGTNNDLRLIDLKSIGKTLTILQPILMRGNFVRKNTSADENLVIKSDFGTIRFIIFV